MYKCNIIYHDTTALTETYTFLIVQHKTSLSVVKTINNTFIYLALCMTS